jgi:serum/glucocorticoid-regulated kinase 2
MHQDVLSKNLIFPHSTRISSELKSLLSTLIILDDLLCKNPINRLGNKKGILDIINHPWCRKIRLADVINLKITPPIKPDPFQMNFEKFDSN